MIIYEARIYRFGSIVEKFIKFDNGINVIYGENEKGKTTIENFIKVMLYGFGKKREERKKYVINNLQSKGELYIYHEKRRIIISRTFGKTKKEDSSLIIDAETGDKIENIDLECPGQYFFDINKSTFEKTLFIGQLGVMLKRDKDEEIMDKIMMFCGAEENEVSAQKALEKINSQMKELRTVRGMGTIDILEKNRGKLLEEKYEGLNISKKNMEWENELMSAKNNRKYISDEIEKLEIYKKYIKRLSMQKEYKEINDYLTKSEKLKKEESILENDLIRENDIIDQNFIEELKKLNSNFLYDNDRCSELNDKLDEYNEKLNILNKKKDKYLYLQEFQGNIKDKLISLKYEFNNLSEKIINSQKIVESIKNDEENIKSKQKDIYNYEKIKNISVELSDCLNEYEEKLRNLSYLMENSDDYINQHNGEGENYKNTKLQAALSVTFLFSGILLSFQMMPYKIIGIILVSLSIIMGLLLANRFRINKADKTNLKKINDLKNDVNEIESNLNKYLKDVGVEDYKSLVILLKRYNAFKDYECKINIRISEKRNILNENEYEQLLNKYSKDKKVITSFLNISKCNNIDEILVEINEYQDLNDEIKLIMDKKDVLEKEKQRLNKSINVIKQKIIKKLQIMGINVSDIMKNNVSSIERYIDEFSKKIERRDEIHNNLKSIEETYNYLIKDKNIDKIKSELNVIIDENIDYSYKSEEEIEKYEKKYARELIECEKKIKDLENNIKTRLIGKRDLITIEEELFDMEKEIKEKKHKYESLKIAYKFISESENEIRREVGPKINKMVSKYFSKLTNGKYNEVILNENYEMLIRYKDELLSQNCLSNGTLDQLYLSLRMAFINLIFKNRDYILFLDDAFVQYDDNRRENAIVFLANQIKNQCFIFTCQRNEQNILKNNNLTYKLINL